MTHRRREKIVMFVLLCLYFVFMMYLLFFHRVHDGAGWLSNEAKKNGYWRTVWNHTNLIPFQTVKGFARSFKRTHQIFGFSFINLAGNVVFFMPIGIFLPYYWKSMRNFWNFVRAVIFLIVGVELTQIFTLTGTCDIDDLLLNTFGGCMGFVLFHIITIIRRAF